MGGGINVGTGVILFGSPDNCSLTLNSCSASRQSRPSAAPAARAATAATAWAAACRSWREAPPRSMTHRSLFNAALGGSAGTGGASGQGLGGGLYIVPTAGVTLSKSTRVFLNFASTSDDNIFGTYTIT